MFKHIWNRRRSASGKHSSSCAVDGISSAGGSAAAGLKLSTMSSAAGRDEDDLSDLHTNVTGGGPQIAELLTNQEPVSIDSGPSSSATGL